MPAPTYSVAGAPVGPMLPHLSITTTAPRKACSHTLSLSCE
jgi:hypothetical protein